MIRHLAALILLVVPATSSLAQVVSPNATDIPKYTLSGTVVNSVTGEPIRRALVEVYAQYPQAMLTDSEGHFQFDQLAAGNYAVHVRKPGFFREGDYSRLTRETGIEVGPDAKALTLKLMPEATIAGTVSDGDGLPVPHLQVRVMRRQIVEGHAQWNPAQQSQTDEYGQFRVAGLMPGTFVVSIGPSHQPAPPTGNTKNSQLLGYRETFLGGAQDANSATRINLLPGQRYEANFSVAAEPFYAVRGMVIGSFGSGIGVMIRSRNADWGAGIPLGMTDPSTGTFESKFVPPGNYVIEASGNDAYGHMSFGRLPLQVSRDIPNVRLALQPQTSISVEVEQQHVSTKHEQAPGGVVYGGDRSGIRSRAMPVSVSMIPKERSPWGGPGTTFNNDRTITLGNVAPGKYEVRFDGAGSWYVDSATQDNVDLLSEDLNVTSSAAQSPVHVVLRDDGAMLRPSLKSDDPLETAVLLLISDRQRSRIREFPITAQGFTYVPPLKPGSYTLLAFDDVSDLEYSNPEVLEPYLSRATRVTLNADQDYPVKVDMIRRRSN